MKYADVQALERDGLITPDQSQKILAHYGLKEDHSRFLAILLTLGAVLAAAGVVLLVAANWDEIPRLVKLAAGLAFMLGAYGGGYYLRDMRQDYPRAGEALYLLGAGLFLSNIALVGQVYHLSSRLPNALLLWWAGIAGLPWILRSTPLHFASLLSFGFWFGGEVLAQDGWLFCGHGATGLCAIGLLGLVYYGWGTHLRRGAWRAFAASTERLGLTAFFFVLYLCSIGEISRRLAATDAGPVVLLSVLAALAVGLAGTGVWREANLTPQWRGVWVATFLGGIGVMGLGLLGGVWGEGITPSGWGQASLTSYAATIVLFGSGLIAIQVGLALGTAFLVNLGSAFIALDVITTYFTLIGTMANTGVVFLVSGVFLIGFGVYLERKRRGYLRRLKSTTTLPAA